jgi:hypothetical protein
MADRLGRLLDPSPTAPPFVCFPLSDTPAPAPLPLTHHWQQAHLLIWCHSPSVASTGPIFKRREIVNFVTSMSGRDQCPHKLLKTRSNDIKSNMKRLLDLIYMKVRLGPFSSIIVFAVVGGRGGKACIIAVLKLAEHHESHAGNAWITMVGGNAGLLALGLWRSDRTAWPRQGIGKIAFPHCARQLRSTQHRW